MANAEHLMILKQGVNVWNKWREQQRWMADDGTLFESFVDLSGANLNGVDLSEANFRGATLLGASLRNANLVEANCQGANLLKADLCAANLARANLLGADLYLAKLRNANLTGARLSGADLTEANCTGANFTEASLVDVSLIGTNLERATLLNCRVYGISVWRPRLSGTIQSNLIITPENEPAITLDNLEVAQFIYLMLNNSQVRYVINTITTKAVLVLGRFMPHRKAVLDAMREELRRRNYVPIMFDFDKPANRDLTETLTTLAHLSRFIIADITDPRSVPQELQAIVPNLPSVPIQPLLHRSQTAYGMFEHFSRYPWVLPLAQYDELGDLITFLRERVIPSAEAKCVELGVH